MQLKLIAALAMLLAATGHALAANPSTINSPDKSIQAEATAQIGVLMKPCSGTDAGGVSANSAGVITLSGSVQQILAPDSKRRRLQIYGASSNATAMYNYSSTVTTTLGIPIYAGGGGQDDSSAVITNGIWIIGTSGNQIVCWVGDSQ